jgi:hypothetical protein
MTLSHILLRNGNKLFGFLPGIVQHEGLEIFDGYRTHGRWFHDSALEPSEFISAALRIGPRCLTWIFPFHRKLRIYVYCEISPRNRFVNSYTSRTSASINSIVMDLMLTSALLQQDLFIMSQLVASFLTGKYDISCLI